MHDSLIIPDDIDFSAWEKETDAKRNVKPVGDWVDDLIHRLRNPDKTPPVLLPWEKTHGVFRFREGEMTMWAGQNGHGKTGVINQVQLSLVGQGQKVVLGSFEASPMTTIENMARMYCCTNPYSPEYQDKAGVDALEALYREFGEWATGNLWLYNQQGTADSANVIGMARYAAKELGCQHVVVDNLAKCVAGEDDFNGQKAFVDELTAIARDYRCHVHLVHHIRKPQNEGTVPDKHDIKGTGAITDQVDNVMLVWRNKPKEDDIKANGHNAKKRDEPDAYLLCRKQRNGDEEPTIKLWFDRDSKQFKGDPADAPMFFPNFPHRPS